MPPSFTHPFVLTLYSVAVGTAAVFITLTVSNWSTYRALRTPALRVYSWFTLFGALQALGVIASFVPMAPEAKPQVFKLMWVTGCTGLALWIESVVRFSSTDGRLLRWPQRVFVGISAVALGDFLLTFTTGKSLLYIAKPNPHPSIVLTATGNHMKHALPADIMSAIVVGFGLLTSALLVGKLLRKERWDLPLLLGVVLTPILFCTEAGLVLIRSKYNLPVIFLANLVEAVRISWASRDDLFRELAEIREERRRQTIMIEGRLAQLRVDQRLANVGEHTAQLSHDLRNPLTTVITGIELAEAALEERPPHLAEVRTAMDDVKVAAQHTLALVSRITRQARQEEEAVARLEVAQLVSDATILSAHRLQGVKVNVDLRGDCRLSGRHTELVQVLVNLITNACEATEPLPHRWISIEAKRTRKEVEIRVTDAGRRPPDSTLDRMFVSRFTSGAKSSSTGLGLTIAKQIVAQHHGQISVDRQSANTSIVLSFPVSISAAPEGPAKRLAG